MPIQTENPNDGLAADLLNGATEISTYLGAAWPRWRVYHFVAKGILPAKKLGPKTLIARKSELDAFLRAEPAEAKAAEARRKRGGRS